MARCSSADRSLAGAAALQVLGGQGGQAQAKQSVGGGHHGALPVRRDGRIAQGVLEGGEDLRRAQVGRDRRVDGVDEDRVRRHRALALHDSADACCWNSQSDAQRIDQASRGLRNSSLSTSPGWAVTRFRVATALVVVDDFDIGGPFLSPDETDAPLVIDPNGVLATTVAAQRFKPVCWRRTQVVEIARGMEHVELSQRLLFYSAKLTFPGSDWQQLDIHPSLSLNKAKE